MTINAEPWWKTATVYQIWPASYKDSNGDGFGDLQGIISELDYVKSLGVDVIWLSPMYDSPQDDMGYDISNYNAIYPKYGTMKDMDQLIDQVHSRGMKLVLDLVVNHTSSEHEWFKESRSSKDNPKRNWYIWKPPKYDEQGNRQPPNNWKSCFSGSAWEWDEHTQEYYLRLFAATQPDLNWECEETREAIYEYAMKFWYEKGVDGFRIDVAALYSKVQTFEDAPIVDHTQKWQPFGSLCLNGPRIHEFHKEMYKKVTSHYDVMTVGEVGHCSREEALKYVSASANEMNSIFLFDLVEVGLKGLGRYDIAGWNLDDMRKDEKNMSGFAEGTDAWATAFSENHDQPRSVSRFGTDKNPKGHNKSAKLLAQMLSSLSGTLYIYQGQEIGMTNLPRSWPISEYKDIETLNYYEDFKQRIGDDKEKLEKLMDVVQIMARDHARSPVQWDNSKHGGFTTGEPWMRVNDNYPEINVASQVNDPSSVFSFWQKCLKVRKSHSETLIFGDLKIVDNGHEKLFIFTKENGNKKALVVLNFSEETVPYVAEEGYNLVLTNFDENSDSHLAPYEARTYIK